MATQAQAKLTHASRASAGTSKRARQVHLVDAVVIGAIVMAACGHLLIKHGLNGAPVAGDMTVAGRLFAYLLQPLVIAGLTVYASGTLLWIAAVSKLDISYVYPLSALNYVVVTLGGLWLLGETVSFERWAGIFVVMSGVTLMQTSGTEGRR
jgi:drug/metabolite transporter (DMT)-like permease